MEKEVFKTKKYEYRVDDERIEVWKKRKFIVSPKISDFRVLYHRDISEKNRYGTFIFITPNMEFSISDQYDDIESARNINLLLEKISSQCIMDLKSLWSASFYKHPKQKKNISFWKKMNFIEKKETKCICSMCSNVWYISEDRLNKSEGNKMMAVGNLISGNMMAASYNANNIGNPFECSQCGSSRITKQNIVFYTDKNGNHVDI